MKKEVPLINFIKEIPRKDKNSDIILDGTEIEVSFREIVSDIRSTTYATHGIYYYPARFIPHVVRFAIQKFTKDKDWVFDPFAGCGTVGVECMILHRNFILWDLNPMLEILMKVKTMKLTIKWQDIRKEIENMFSNTSLEFHPKWKNRLYWYEKPIYDFLVKLWGYWHYEIENTEIKNILSIPLMHVSRKYSYADDQVPKVYKSKKKKEFISKIIKTNWKNNIKIDFITVAKETFKRVSEFNRLVKNWNVEYEIRTGIDAIDEDLEKNIQLVITSPPYLIAQEYIRSSKIELYWIGFDDKYIRELSKKEIPYNKERVLSLDIEIKSETYEKYYNRVKELQSKKLLEYYEVYFKSIIYIFQKIGEHVNTMAIFIGPASLRKIPIPIHKIIREHFESLGWRHLGTLKDKIKSRKLFKDRKTNRIEYEYLTILSQNKSI